MACDFIDISNPIWSGLIGSAATWMVISIGKRIRTIYKFRNLTGEYHGLSMNNENHSEDKIYNLTFDLCKNILIINQSSSNKGNWTSEIPISDSQPLTGMGNFEYTDDNNKGNWGIINVTINPERKMLCIETRSMDREASARFILKKKTPF